MDFHLDNCFRHPNGRDLIVVGLRDGAENKKIIMLTDESYNYKYLVYLNSAAICVVTYYLELSNDEVVALFEHNNRFQVYPDHSVFSIILN